MYFMLTIIIIILNCKLPIKCVYIIIYYYYVTSLIIRVEEYLLFIKKKITFQMLRLLKNSETSSVGNKSRYLQKYK